MSAEAILIVSAESELTENLTETLRGGGYRTTAVQTFGEALNALVLERFQVAITTSALPDMSGMDLLAMVGSLCPETRVILIDNELSTKSAVAALRLGAADYLYRPLNLELLLMSIQREIDRQAYLRQRAASAKPLASKPRSVEREQWINPATRPAALRLNHAQFTALEEEMHKLNQQIHAEFVGLFDSGHNVISAVGKLEHIDWLSLREVLPSEHTTGKLAALLGDDFAHTHFEGEQHSVFVVGFGKPHPVSLVAICSVSSKPGLVWLSCKRSAVTIDTLLKMSAPPIMRPAFSPQPAR
ncbi:MAG: response regulator [Chloroflexi bacterium]|nr:response regulator [Chloroflexota bacterium]